MAKTTTKKAKPAAAKPVKNEKAEKIGRPGVRDKKLFPTVDENPFKRGWSKDSWDAIAASPGKTFRQYVEEGGRVPAISHAVRVGWLRAE